jgi:membrane-associated phospholipid phosphatase
MFIKTVKENKPLLISYLLVVVIGIIILSLDKKIPLQISINSFANDTLDSVFLIITKLAEGWITVPVLVYFLIKDWKKALFIGICYGVTAIIAALLKNYTFGYNHRPFGIDGLNQLETYHWIKNYKMPRSLSFPSGHTTTAFTFAIVLSLLNKNKWLSITFIVIASLVGLSRTLLSFHFLIDVVAGAIIGGVTSFILFVMLKKRFNIKS